MVCEMCDCGKWLPCCTTIRCAILDPTWKAAMQRVLGLETKIRRKRKEFNRKASSFMPWYEMVSIRCRLHNASLHLLGPLLPLIHGSAAVPHDRQEWFRGRTPFHARGSSSREVPDSAKATTGHPTSSNPQRRQETEIANSNGAIPQRKSRPTAPLDALTQAANTDYLCQVASSTFDSSSVSSWEEGLRGWNCSQRI